MNKVKLGELCDAIIDCPHSTPQWTDSGVIAIRNFNLEDTVIAPSNPSFVSEATFQERTHRGTPEAGDIVISREAPIGKVGIVPDGMKCCLGQRLVLLKPNRRKINPRYLFAALTSGYVKIQYKRADTLGSIVSNLSLPQLRDLEIPVVDDSNEVAALVGALDDKIALNKRMIAELDQTARLIYDYWFMQFDFPDENGRPYRSSGGKMVYNETLKRDIPAGWEAGTLGDFVEIVRDSFVPQEGTVYEHYSIPAYDERLFPVFEDGSCIQSGKYRITFDCLLYSKLNPRFKRLWQPYCLSDDSICSTEFIVMKPKVDRLLPFCRSVVDSKWFYAYMAGKAVSSTGSRARVDPEAAFAFEVAIPVDNCPLEIFSFKVGPLYSEIQRLQIERHSLSSLRDWLLPMLMNGQVTVSD